jgi:hypothetical protein
MNSGLMLCIEPDWMDTLYDVHFEQFNVFQGLSDQFKGVLHQMFIGNDGESQTVVALHYALIDVRPFNIRSIKPAAGDSTTNHDAHLTGTKCSVIITAPCWIGWHCLALSLCHRLVQMCWSALLGALTPMLTKNHTIDADFSASNMVLSNTISEKLIETHELVFQGLKLVFRLAITVGKKTDFVPVTVSIILRCAGLPNNACYVLHCVVSTIEQGWIMDNQRKIFAKQNRLHYLDVMAINFVLQLYMSDVNSCPSITYKHILRYCLVITMTQSIHRYVHVILDVACTCVCWKCSVVHQKKNSI